MLQAELFNLFLFPHGPPASFRIMRSNESNKIQRIPVETDDNKTASQMSCRTGISAPPY